MKVRRSIRTIMLAVRTMVARGASCLFLSSLWPEPGSSAAGVRTEGLIRAFQQWGYDVSYAAGAAPNEYTDRLREAGVATFECGPNREADLSRVIATSQPTVVIFDRFFNEEAFSFRVRELAPDALRVLDMQDVHSLRRGRQQLVERAKDGQPGCERLLAASLAHVPPATSEPLLRELAAVHRSDLTLVCSPVEQALLQRVYAIPQEKLALASFFCDEAAPDDNPAATGFGFETAGCCSHGSNQDPLLLELQLTGVCVVAAGLGSRSGGILSPLAGSNTHQTSMGCVGSPTISGLGSVASCRRRSFTCMAPTPQRRCNDCMHRR